MAVGLPAKTTYVDGDVFSSSDINDTNGTINLIAQTQNFYAGKNKIINGDFGVWQRGTSISATGTYAYISDRWQSVCDGAITGARTAFTPGAAPVAGYEGDYYLQYTKTSGTYWQIQQYIEEVQTLAGQTATISFWAKVDAAKTIYVQLSQNFGSGGSSTVTTTAGTQALTTSWVRYSFTVAVPSISGKTVGTGSNLALEIGIGATTGNIVFDIWGVQIEAGSTATAFQTASGSIGGELALCQRYYYRNSPTSTSTYMGVGQAMSTTVVDNIFILPVTMRANPTALETNNMGVYASGATRSGGTFTLQYANPNTTTIRYTHGSAVFTNGSSGWLLGTTSGPYIGLSAEL